MTKTINNLFKSTLSAVTIAAFALVPFAHSGVNTAIAQQEVPECTVVTETVVSGADTTGGVLVVPPNAGWTATIVGASWVWKDAGAGVSAATGTEVFSHSFEWSSDATTTATLEIAADNTYSVTVNSNPAVVSPNPEDNFSSSNVIDISEHIIEGTNVVEFTVTNLGEDPNPAGLLYRIDLEGEDCPEVDPVPTGEIISPTEEEVVSGTTTLEAVYIDGDDEDDDAVQWAVRAGACDADPTPALFGNVDGQDDPFDWDGMNFSADIDTTTVDDGDYCFIFNPTDDGETDVREVRNFTIDNDGPVDQDPVATTTVTVNKVIVNDDGGTATTTDFTLLVGSMEVESGVATSVEPGVYVVDEFGTSTPLYQATFSGDCNAEGEITVDEGDHLVCTITNNDIEEADQCVAIDLDLVSEPSGDWVAVDNATSTEGNQIPEEWTADIDGATWIWVDAQNDGDAATTTETYTREFQWNSDATTTASLMIATDNSYEVSINGTLVADVDDEINFTLDTQDSYNVGNLLVDGTNTLEIAVTNADNGGENPAGLLYSLAVDGFNCSDDEPAEDDDEGGRIGGGSVLRGSGGDGNNNNNDSNGGSVLGRFIDLFDNDEACVLTDDADDLRDEVRSFIISLDDIREMIEDEDWNDAEDAIEDLEVDADILRDMLDDEGFDAEADDLNAIMSDLADAIGDEDLNDSDDLSEEIADMLEEVFEDLEDECVDDDGGFVLGDTVTFPGVTTTGTGGGVGFPNTGAGPVANTIPMATVALTGLLAALGVARGFLRK